MPTNEFYEFATSSAAYVETLPDYVADVERTAGQQSGVARAELNNRALRQGSAMAAAIGSFMSAQGYDALDDGDTATRAADFAAAVAALIQPDIIAAVNAAKINVLQTVFPVGSIYTSYSVSTNPAALLGFGSWTAIQGRMLLGASSAYPATSSGGAATHAITVAELPPHSHTGSTASAGAHTHTGSTASAGDHTHTTYTWANGYHDHTATTSTTGSHTHTRGTMEITGGIPQEWAIRGRMHGISSYGAFTVNVASRTIRDISDGASDKTFGFDFVASRSWTGATSSAGNHNHTLTTSGSGTHTHDVTVNLSGAHTHSVSVTSAGDHTHTVNISNTGGGSAMSLLPPYVAVYMWRRTA